LPIGCEKKPQREGLREINPVPVADFTRRFPECALDFRFAREVRSDDEIYTATWYVMSHLDFDDPLVFGFIDVSRRAPEGYIYLYRHKDLSAQVGREVRHLKYQ
jgi:hypothetical protein